MVGQADWSIAVGILVFIIALVIAIIYYVRYKKVYLIAFVASVATYVFAVFYTWDVFELHKNWILIILATSSFLMLFLGKYFSKFELKKDKMHTSLKEKEI